MNHAAALLLRSDATIKDVASHLGFADAFHFSRMFKSVYGVSPKRFIERAGVCAVTQEECAEVPSRDPIRMADRGTTAPRGAIPGHRMTRRVQ